MPLADQLGPVPERLRRYPLEELRAGAGSTTGSGPTGWFAPMEEPSLDIRRYVLDRLGAVEDPT